MTTVALCGAGMIAGAHAAAAAVNGFALVGVASRSAQRTVDQARQWKTRALTYEQLPAGADIVVVSTPPQCHAADATRLVEAGAAVLVEKPLCATLAEADRLVGLSGRAGVHLAYGENLLAAPATSELIRRVSQLGSITHVEARTLQGIPTWGGFTTDEWGGGALFDLGVHPLAMVMVLGAAAGLGRVIGVRGALRGGEGHGSDEWGEAVLRFASGTTARVEASWQHGPEPQWDVQIAGASGVLRAELMPVVAVEHNGEAVPLPHPPAALIRGGLAPIVDYGYASQLMTLADAVSVGRPVRATISFGRDVLEVVCAAYASAAGGAQTAPGNDEIPLPFTGQRDLTPLQLWRSS